MGGKHLPGTPRDRALGAELRAIREQAQLSLEAVCKVIQLSPALLSRLERGQRHISSETVMGLAVVYRLDAARRNELVKWAKEPSKLGWWDRPPPGISTELGALASYESEAIRMTDWSPCVIPGLLQTPAYSEAFMRFFEVPDSGIEYRLGARRKRQELLDRNHVDYTAFIGSAALANRLCDTSAFADQLGHLVRRSRRENIVIRLVEEPIPLAFGGWYLMDFERSGPVVLVEHLASSTFLFDEETKPYVESRRRLSRMALSEQATRDKIESLVDQLTHGS